MNMMSQIRNTNEPNRALQPLILAIETSSRVGSVALALGAEPLGHIEGLDRVIEHLLGRGGGVGDHGVQPRPLRGQEVQQPLPLGDVEQGEDQAARAPIGAGDRESPAVGGSGVVFIDDIGFGKPTTAD